MTDQEKIEFLQTAIKELFNRSVNISPDNLLIDLKLDSLDIVELQVYYEEQSGIELSDDTKLVTVKNLMDLMK